MSNYEIIEMVWVLLGVTGKLALAFGFMACMTAVVFLISFKFYPYRKNHHANKSFRSR